MKSAGRIRRSVILTHISSRYNPLEVDLCGI